MAKGTVTGKIRARSFDADENTVELVYSTGAAVDRGGYIETLDISEDAIDATRLDAGAVSLIQDHMPWGSPIGRVVDHRIEDGAAVAVVQLSESDEHADTVRDIKAGVIRTVSVGYTVIDSEMDDVDGTKVRRVTRWQPAEISLTVLPADPQAQIRSAAGARSQGDAKMKGKKFAKKTRSLTDEEIQAIADEAAAAAVAEVTEEVTEEIVAEVTDEVVAELEEEIAADEEVEEEARALEDELEEDEQAEDEEGDEAEAAERTRAAQILALTTRHRMPLTFATRHITRGTSLTKVRREILSNISKRSAKPVMPARPKTDDRATLTQRASEALYARLTGRRAAADVAGPLGGMRVVDIARRFIGDTGFELSERAVLARANSLEQRSGMHTSSDFSFTAAVGQAVNRRARELAAQVEIPLMPIVREISVNDFRPMDTYGVGGFPELLETPEGGEYEAGTVATDGSTIQIRKYGRILNLSFEALVNDDLRLLDAAIRGAAVSGMRLKNKVIRAAFASKLADGKDLFTAARGNLITDGLDLAGLSKARAALRKTKSVDGEPMGLTPKFLVVGPELETEAQQLISPITAAVTGEVNPFASHLQLIVDDMFEGQEWMLSADPLMADGIELASLAGQEGVNVEEIVDPRNDGISYRARAFAGAAPTGWRGLIKSTGTA